MGEYNTRAISKFVSIYEKKLKKNVDQLTSNKQNKISGPTKVLNVL